MTEIILTISSKDYTIKLEDEFASVFQRDVKNFLDTKRQLNVKDLLTAFVQKCHEGYLQEKELQKILKDIDENDTI